MKAGGMMYLYTFVSGFLFARKQKGNCIWQKKSSFWRMSVCVPLIRNGGETLRPTVNSLIASIDGNQE